MWQYNPRSIGSYSPIRASSSSGIHPSLRQYLLAYWDMRNTPPVSLPLTNLVTNGDFSNGTTGFSATAAVNTVASNVLTNTGNGTSSYPRWTFPSAMAYVSGNKIYIKARWRVTNSSCTSSSCQVTATGMATQSFTLSSPTQDTWYIHSGVVTLAAGGSGNIDIIFGHQYADAATANGKINETQYVVAIDLTTKFGAGNEPTAAEMDAILLANYPSTSWFDGTASLVINPNGQIFLPDTSGKGEHLKYRNMAYTAASGPQSGSPPYVKCDGTDDYMRRKLTTPIASGSAVSCALWFRTSAIASARRLIYLENMGFQGMYVLITSSNLTVSVNDGAGAQTAVISVSSEQNKWIFAVATYNPSDKKGRIYFNGGGVQESSALVGQLVTITDAIMANTASLTAYQAGDYSDICIFNKTLTDAEVLSLYQYSRNRYGV